MHTSLRNLRNMLLSRRSPKLLPPTAPEELLYEAWLASRELPARTGGLLVPGATRPITWRNARLALSVSQNCFADFLKSLWALNPCRTTAMVGLNLLRSLFPALRGYSQALIVDELHSLIASDSFTWTRLLWLILSEFLRRLVEGALDSLAASNETHVLGEARFYVEYKQIEQRVRLDAPTLADPVVRDLLQESEMFARAFNGGSFGVISPLDFIHIFSLLVELASHLVLIASLTRGGSHVGILLLSVFSIALPLLAGRWGSALNLPDQKTTAREVRASQRQERMRNLAYNDMYRSEIVLFGLGDWILKSWSNARKTLLVSDNNFKSASISGLNMNMSEMLYVLQNIPLLLLLQNSGTSLGSLTVYRSSLQSMVYASRNLITSIKMAFQGIFLMSAFLASMKLTPKLQPKLEDTVKYNAILGGASLDVRGLSYTYPGSHDLALRNVTFSLNAGETLAIVGYNGSGKSTLAKVLLRIIDFDRGTFLLNDTDVRQYNPEDLHRHQSAVFQGFCKYDATIKKNIGLGNVDKIGYRPIIEKAVHLAEANAMVGSLPNGLRTHLETSVHSYIPYAGAMSPAGDQRHGLSGGEWQRIAIARAFMRADEPDVDFLLFDEPTSSLDAHAQNRIFDAIDKVSRTPTGKRLKTVIFITHRLSTARRADKVAMMENGTISEFGTHEELLRKKGTYAALYEASV